MILDGTIVASAVTLASRASNSTDVRDRPRALLVRHPDGDVLSNCVSFVDQDTVDSLAALGGVSAIANLGAAFLLVDHRSSQAFSNMPIHLHDGDTAWIVAADPRVNVLGGRAHPMNDLTLVRCGGHLEGSSLLHVAGSQRPTLLTATP